MHDVADPTFAPVAAVPAEPVRPPVTVGELLVLGALLAVAVAGWASLALAHVGHHDGVAVLALTVVVTGAAGLLVARSRLPVRLERNELLALGGTALLCGVMFFPGFPYGVADKDPGVYVVHGYAIADTGSYDIDDPVLAPGVPGAEASPGARFAGIWVNDAGEQRIVPQFFHLLPALFATAHDLGGDRALFNVAPTVMTLSVLALLLAVRRAAGWLPALLAVGLLATNMMQVWAAKYPATEGVTQMLTVGAALGVVVAVTTGWRAAAGLAGLFVGIGWLVRPDGILVVMFAVAVGALLFAVRRFDARAAWFAVGMALPLPHALIQAYDYDFAARYARITNVPRPWFLVLVVAALFGAAALWRWVEPRGAPIVRSRLPWLDGRRAMLLAGGALVAGLAVYVVLSYLRPWILGDNVTHIRNVSFRSWNERNMLRLSWYLTFPGVALMVLGAGVLALRRWTVSRWAIVLPGLALFPLYIWNARISPHMMWWTRRFIPFVITAVAVLMALGIAWLVTRSGRARLPGRVVGGALAVYVVVSFLAMSWPLRSHGEFDRSVAATTELASRAGADRAVFLFRKGSGHVSMFGAPLWLVKGQVSSLFGDGGPAEIAAFQRAFPGLPVVLVSPEPELPARLAGLPFEPLPPVEVTMPEWEWTYDAPPDRAHPVPVRFNLWRLPAGEPAEPAA